MRPPSEPSDEDLSDLENDPKVSFGHTETLEQETKNIVEWLDVISSHKIENAKNTYTERIT